eukprot:jgi/Mesen1/4972/ME000248S04255
MSIASGEDSVQIKSDTFSPGNSASTSSLPSTSHQYTRDQAQSVEGQQRQQGMQDQLEMESSGQVQVLHVWTYAIISLAQRLVTLAKGFPQPIGNSVPALESVAKRLASPVITPIHKYGPSLLDAADAKLSSLLHLGGPPVVQLGKIFEGLPSRVSRTADKLYENFSTPGRGLVGAVADTWVEVEPSVTEDAQAAITALNSIPLVCLSTPLLKMAMAAARPVSSLLHRVSRVGPEVSKEETRQEMPTGKGVDGDMAEADEQVTKQAGVVAGKVQALEEPYEVKESVGAEKAALKGSESKQQQQQQEIEPEKKEKGKAKWKGKIPKRKSLDGSVVFDLLEKGW